MNADEAQAVQLVGGEQLVIPFGQDAHLVWTRTNGQTAAVGLIRQGNKTLNVGGDGQERVVRFLSAQKAEKLLRKLREKSKFQDFEGKLAQKGKRVGKVRVLFDETNKIAILGIAAEGDEKIGHQVRIKVKAGKDDEPEDDAEPMIQATACGQASGEAVPTGARMQPLAVPPGDGGSFEGGYEGPQICTSQWGYDYLCLSRTPSVSLSTTSLALPQTFINQPVQASFTIWNGGGGKLTGTVSAPAPFSIVSGGSFSLLPGQPQQVTVKFSSTTAGSFSQNLTITSNAGTKLMPVSGVAHKVTFSPATVNFGEGLFVVTQQCGGETGECMPYTKKVGLPLQGKLVVKNEGTVAVSLNLSTSAPFYLPNGGSLTLAAGQSVEVAVRFDPADSGAFTGVVQVGLQGGQGSLTSGPLMGTAHKIEISSTRLDFGLALVGSSPRPETVTVKNQGVTTITLEPLHTIETLPFHVVIGAEPVRLVPAESTNVKVEFLTNVPGTFSGKVGLATIGPLILEVSATGLVYTEEELMAWFEQQRQADGEACQASRDTRGIAPALYVPTGELDAILYGFRCLAEDEFRELIRFILAGEWEILPPPLNLDHPDSTQPFPFNPDTWDAQKVLAAIVWISSQPDPSQAFEQAYNGSCSSCISWAPAFQQFVSILRLTDLDLIIGPIKISLAIDPLFEGDRGKGVTLAISDLLKKNPVLVGTIMGMMATLSQRISNPWVRMYYQGTAFYMIGRVWKAAHTLDPWSSYAQAGFTETLAVSFVNAMATLISQPQGSLPEQALWVLGQMILNAGKVPFLFPTVEQMANATGQVVTLGGLVNNGWDVKYVQIVARVNNPGLYHTDGLDMVAVKVINGRLTAGFIHVEAKLGPQEVDSVAKLLRSIALVASNSIARANFQSQYRIPASADGVAILIAYNSDQTTVNTLVQRLGTPDATIVIIWVDSENIVHATGVCGRRGCPGGKTAQEYANSIAQALGLQPSQPFENSPVAESGYSAEFLMTFFVELLQMCAGNADCAMYHYQWWLRHYSCLNNNPGSSRFQVLDYYPCRP